MLKTIKATITNYNYKAINIRLIIYLLAITVLGTITVGSAGGEFYFKRQLIGSVVGFIILTITMFISYKFIFKFYWPLYFLTILLLLAVEVFGRINLGAERWFTIFGLQFQPSEICKIFLIIFVAVYITKYKDRLNTFKVLFPLTGLIAIPLALIFAEPDLSTTIVTFVSLSMIIYLGGLNYRIIFGLLAFITPFAIVLGYLIWFHPEIKILSPHQYKRLIGFYQPENKEAAQIRYQQENALLAIGSGGLTGKGLYNDDETSVKNGNLLPECHTDFIFTVVGEEMGFLGAISVIVLILLIVMECFIVGAHSRDFAGKLFCYGIGGLIATQALVNISVNTMILPNTGLTLPFVSYGLTSLMSLFIGMGIVLNVGLHSQKKLYNF
ncbi:MAG: FtsW/RodA/SpoVE family cell cycle protein [Lachnospiraceae bacterium]|nr:FtsW/RodA/SpoVE family cell cycle protein [Lachnospiraceae bacterium]